VAAGPAGAGRAGEGRGIARNKRSKRPHSGPSDRVAHQVAVVDKGLRIASSSWFFFLGGRPPPGQALPCAAHGLGGGL
jgi:hypothetical protein